MSSLPQDDSKPPPTSFLSRVVALGRKYEPNSKKDLHDDRFETYPFQRAVIVSADIFSHRTKYKDEH